jgi:HEAT repeat protein
MVSHFFCPNCWKEIDGRATVCPHCEYDISEYTKLSYEEKLINALRQPIRENRMMAIRLLGELRSKAALAPFAAILETEEDFYVITIIILALDKIGNEESRNMIQRLKTHKSRLVRKAATKVMSEIS